MQRLKKVVFILFLSYIIYCLFFGIFIFRIHEPLADKSEFKYITNTLGRKDTEDNWQDSVVLLEDGPQSGVARIDMIEQAENTIDVAYYTLHKGAVTNTFLGLLLDAADQGVQVRILLDGIFHNLRGNLKDAVYSFADHPNVELKYYEPLHLLKPWTWNNRLHDKLIVVDEKFAIIGGRNIGDKYFVKAEQEPFVEDRDVLIINQQLSNQSVIHDMKRYFQELWNHDYSEPPIKKVSNGQQKKGQKKSKELLQELNHAKLKQPNLFNRSIDWNDLSIGTEKITFIHNPIQRLNKEPWVWLEINHLMESAKKSIVIESPYVIPTNKMMKYSDQISIPQENITIITNSLTSTPNPLAFSGYLRHVDNIVEKGLNLLEYIGPNSIHGKTYIIDHDKSVIGSFNLDSRSTFLSTESMVIIESTEFADHLYNNMENRVFQNQTAIHTNVEDDNRYASFIKNIFLRALSIVTAFYQHML